MQNVQQNKNTYFDQQIKSAIAGKQKADRNWTTFSILHGGALYFWDELRTCKETYWSSSGLLSFQGGKNELYFLYSATTLIISQLFCSRHKVNTGDSHARLLTWPGIVQLQSNMLLPSSLQLAISSILACRPTAHTCTVFSSSQNWNAASLSKSHIFSK